jgi:O-antigen/teichoic acid export membrane protein
MSEGMQLGVTTTTHDDTFTAVRNAARLGGSLALTWGVAVVVRLMMPRYLGPDAWGPLNFADAFTTTFFVALSLGIDTYIRREVSVRPEYASDFLAGITALRVVITVVLLAVMQAVLVASGRPVEVQQLVFVFGLACFVGAMNQTLAALLHAKGTVKALSVLNVVAKLVWALGSVLTLVRGWPLLGLPLSLLLSELIKLVGGHVLVRTHLGVVWKLDPLALRVALVASAPMFLNTAAHTIYNKLDITILAVVAGDREVAWYGAASLLAGMTLVVAPIIGWVLMPLFARARARSEAEYTAVLRRSLELVLTFAFPTALMMALGAEVWVTLLYGAAYAPAAVSLKLLSPLFVLTYVAMLNATSLILTGRAWAQAFVSIAGVGINPLLNSLFIPFSMRTWGEGGAGRGAACAQLGTELTVTAVMTVLVGARAFDRRTMGTVARTLLVCAAVWAIDEALRARVGPAPRLLCDVLAYLGLAVASGAIHLRETVTFAREALRRPSLTPTGTLP